MRNGIRIITAALLLTGLCFAQATRAGRATRALPSVEVVSADGAKVALSDLEMSGRWLLIYIQADSRASEMLLSQIKPETFSQYGDRIVILVGGVDSQQLAALKEKHADLTTIKWFADQNRDGYKQLNLSGAPVEMGMQDGNIQWKLNGAQANTSAFNSTMVDWVREPEQQRRAN